MKFSSSNVKNQNYRENHELFVGTGIGAFKKLQVALQDDPHEQKNLVEISKLTKESAITALAFGKQDKSEILIGRHNVIEIFNIEDEQIKHSLSIQKSKVAGLAAYDKYIVAGFVNGEVRCMPLNEGTAKEAEENTENAANEADESFKFIAGDNIAHMRQCPSAPHLIATGGEGRQNNLKIFDLSAGGKQIFTSKNLPNDYLQLEVPVWDSDVGFIDNENTLATCSRHGYVRVYDTRQQRRPVQWYESKEQMSFTTLAAKGNYIYTGTTMGAMKAFDKRRLKNFVHTYKGCTGTVSDLCLDSTGNYLASSSLDRYVRVHHTDSCLMLYQTFVNSQATRVLLREATSDPNMTRQLEQKQATNGDSDLDDYSAEDDDEDVEEAAEYDNIFNNMETVQEKTDNAESDYDDDEDDYDEEDDDEEEDCEEEEKEPNYHNGNDSGSQIEINDDDEEEVEGNASNDAADDYEEDDDDDDVEEIEEDESEDGHSNHSSESDENDTESGDEDRDASGVKRKTNEDSDDYAEDNVDSEEEFVNTHKKQKQ